MSNRIYIESDWWDFYDHWSTRKGEPYDYILQRPSVDPFWSKPQQFHTLQRLGYQVPKFGTAWLLACTLGYNWDKHWIVIYTDSCLHRGLGKSLISCRTAALNYVEYFSSDYLGDFSIPAVSIRYLFVGDRCFKLRYSNYSGWGRDLLLNPYWQSNYGDEVKIEILGEIDPPVYIEEPLVAVDCIEWKGEEYAVDFNISPQIKGTGLEWAYIKPEECLTLIGNKMLAIERKRQDARRRLFAGEDS